MSTSESAAERGRARTINAAREFAAAVLDLQQAVNEGRLSPAEASEIFDAISAILNGANERLPRAEP